MSRISVVGVLVRTVLQLGFTVQSSGKKRCGSRVGELRKWVGACNEPTGSPACEPLSLCSVCPPKFTVGCAVLIEVSALKVASVAKASRATNTAIKANKLSRRPSALFISSPYNKLCPMRTAQATGVIPRQAHSLQRKRPESESSVAISPWVIESDNENSAYMVRAVVNLLPYVTSNGSYRRERERR